MENQLHLLLLCALIFITSFAFLHLIKAQDQKEKWTFGPGPRGRLCPQIESTEPPPLGFISLDCGSSPNETPYNDPSTELTYSRDDSFVQSGKTGRIQKQLDSFFRKPLLKLRYFPYGDRNCFTLNVTQGTKYLIRTTFVYGNYDGLDNPPTFDLYLGPNLWSTVDMEGKTNGTFKEIIHKTISKSLNVCLVKIGTSLPIINTLELRPLKNSTYNTQSGSLMYIFRFYFSTSSQVIRYPDDVHDRRWYPSFDSTEWTELTTSLKINNSDDKYETPQAVMASASTPISTSATWNYSLIFLPSSATQFYIYIHFAEIQTLKSIDIREFDVKWNGEVVVERYSPKTLTAQTFSNSIPVQCKQGTCLLELAKTPKSTLPPLMNALEVFTVIDFPQLETNQDDVFAMKSIQKTYGLSKISWQGDPCVPIQFLWEGLKCNALDISSPPIITSLNLSSSNLTGIITPDFQNLTHLEELDLSNNNLTGEIPEFLADIKSLLLIDLSGNDFNGNVPQALLQKKGLKLKCSDGLCVNNPINEGGMKKHIIIAIVASVAFIVILGSALAFYFLFKKKKTSNNQGPSSSTQDIDTRETRSLEPTIMTKNRRFTYSEVVMMTNNFERVIGKGGFGMVYHGTVNNTEQVAVKMLSQSSSQGYKEFKAEVELLLRVHHKNLVGLVGYCDEGENLALIYEYMANGDLREHMLGKRGRSILNWETRLKIVIESAQGLEYLHIGCRPPMVHRDVKTTNILLNEHFQAKLADFGLSRSCPIEGETHVSTGVAGTPGYLDPEYYRTNWLNEKSDVYSFGIVLLEVITNQPVINQSREKPHIAEWVGVMLTKGDIKNIVDPKLYGDYDSSSVWRTVELAMSCLNPSSAKRPTMSQVVIELNECLAYETSREGISQSMNS